jgi:hypothetical protein
VKMAVTPSEMYSQTCSVSSSCGTWYTCIEQMSHVFPSACCKCVNPLCITHDVSYAEALVLLV